MKLNLKLARHRNHLLAAAACAAALVSSGTAQTVTFTKVPRDMQVYPRNLVSNTAVVQIEGQVVTGGYDRAVLSIARDGAPYAAYSQDLAYVSGAAPFSFSQTIVAELKNYNFELSLVMGTTTNLALRVTNVVAGDFFMANGQSNADASRSESNTNQSPFLRSFGTRSSQGSVVTNDLTWRLAEGGQSQGPAAVGAWCMRLGRLIVDNYGIPVAIQNASLAATAISYFQRDDSNHENVNNNYGRLLFRMREAGCTDHVRAYLYWQGETDRLYPLTHTNGFYNLYNDWLEDYPNLEKVYVQQTRQGYCSTTNYYDTFLRNSQRLFRNAMPKVTTMSANAIDAHDGCHFANAGYAEVGEHFFNIIARDLYGSLNTNNVESPDIERAYAATPDRRTVTLVMRNKTDTLTMDPGAENDFFTEGTGYLAPTGGTASSNTIVLTFPQNCLNATGISYTGHPFDGAWVKNARGVGLLTFYNVPIEFPPIAQPGVENPQGAANVRATAADLRGTLINEGTGPTYVFAYWGATDGGTNENAWDGVEALGVKSGNNLDLSVGISNLQVDTQYYYRYFASNTAGVFWSSASTAFRTAPALRISSSPGATNITATSAEIRGNLESAGTVGSSTRICIYWGTDDAGTNAGAWEHTLDLGLCAPAPFSTTLSGLTSATRYYYRCYGSNALGESWSTNAAAFPTLASTAVWSSQCKISFSGYNKPETLTNFPALVILNEAIPNFKYSQFGSVTGDDLRFYDAAGFELNYEIDQWNFNGSSYVWVQVPRLTNGSYVTAKWGNASAAKPAYTTNGATWNDGYLAVWHMSAQPIKDSTAAKNQGTPFGNVWTTNGLGGGAQWFDGQRHQYKWFTWEEDAGINVAHFPRPEEMTISAWLIAPPFSAARDIVAWTPTSDAAEFRLMDVGRLWYGEATAGSIASLYTSSSVADSTLRFVSITRKADDTVRLYVDGNQAASGTVARTPATTTLRIGARASDDYNFSGMLDELRIENVARSANWLWACRMNQASNQLFSTYSSVTAALNVTSVDNGAGAANVTFNSATLTGNLSFTNATPTFVWIYWGGNDGGTNQGLWANALPLGERPLGPFSAEIADLAGSTPYYYRCYASNSVDQVWADATASFSTWSPLPMVTNAPAGSITMTSATLNGQLLSIGAAATSVQVYWGPNDGGTIKANWYATTNLGAQTVGPLQASVSGLAASTRYYYRYLASNSFGESWAATTESFQTTSPGGGGGTWYWDKGGDSSTWANALNWSNVTTRADNDAYPNGPGAVALNLSGTLSANPQNFTVGELYGVSTLTLGSDSGTTNQVLTLDNSGGRAVWQNTATGSGNVYYNLNLASDLYLTNTSSGALYFYRRNITGPGKEFHVTTLGSGGVRFSMEDPATGSNTFGNLHIHDNSSFLISEALRNPPRTPLGQGTLFLYPGARLSVILRLSITNNMQLLGNATVAFDGTRADGVQLNGVISGSGRLTVDNTGVTSVGNVKLGGALPNTYTGGTIVKGAAGNCINYLVLQKNGAAGSGDLLLTNLYARLQITDGGATDDRISDSASVYLAHVGTNYARITLDANVSETVSGLYFDGAGQAPGTYGSSASAAANKNDNWFSGTGVLTVAPNPDTDGDGLLDAWEMTNFGNLATANATTDFDLDGQSDFNEYRAGTIPTNSASVFAFTELSYSPQGGSLVLKWQSVAGKQYSLENASNLLNPAWQTLISNLPATPPINSCTTPPSTAPSLLFRLSTH